MLVRQPVFVKGRRIPCAVSFMAVDRRYLEREGTNLHRIIIGVRKLRVNRRIHRDRNDETMF